jgi:hypothetical protein
VNKEILGETGVLYKVLTDPTGAEFTAIRTLNESTHGSLRFLLMCAQMARNPKFRPDFPRYFEHVDRYWAYLNYMEEMFRGGKTRADVLVGVRNMHKPRAAWTTLPGVSGADVKP